MALCSLRNIKDTTKFLNNHILDKNKLMLRFQKAEQKIKKTNEELQLFCLKIAL